MTTILDLPADLIDDIFSRVPSESVRAARSTCKAWNALIYRRFAKTMDYNVKVTTNEARELGESRMIVMMNHNLYLTSIVLNENPSAKRLGKLTSLTREHVKISQVFHCDGLLLCILKDNKRLVVWNPCLGETRWIEKGRHADKRVEYKYAIGYEEDSCRRRHYKILRFRDAKLGDADEDEDAKFQQEFILYETYEFDSSSWTRQYYNAFRVMEFCDRGVSIKGNTYWCVTDSLRQIGETICFDFTRNRFLGLQDLPFRAPYCFKHLVSLSSVRDEKLSVLVMSKGTLLVDVWISDKIDKQNMSWISRGWKKGDWGTKVSWSKFLRVDMGGPFSSLVSKISDGGFFVEEEKKIIAMVFSKDVDEKSDTVKVFGEDGYFRELDLGESSDKECWPLVCPYVPSSVQIKPHKSCSEKRRYDENMLGYDNKRIKNTRI